MNTYTIHPKVQKWYSKPIKTLGLQMINFSFTRLMSATSLFWFVCLFTFGESQVDNSYLWLTRFWLIIALGVRSILFFLWTHLHVLRSKKYCIVANERQFDLVSAVLRILRLRINPYMKRFPAFNFIKNWK